MSITVDHLEEDYHTTTIHHDVVKVDIIDGCLRIGFATGAPTIYAAGAWQKAE